jgi:hypothetical protein
MDKDVLLDSVQNDGLLFIRHTSPQLYDNEVLYTVLRSLLHHGGNHTIRIMSEKIMQTFPVKYRELIKEIR